MSIVLIFLLALEHVTVSLVFVGLPAVAARSINVRYFIISSRPSMTSMADTENIGILQGINPTSLANIIPRMSMRDV